MTHANISHNPHICLSPSSFPSLAAGFHTDPYSTCTCRAKLLPHLPKSNPLPFFYLHMFSTSISYFVCLLDILPGSGVNCSLVLEQQEPRRTTTAVRDGRRQQQLVGVVGGHGRRGTGACSALLYLLPCHAMVFL